MRSRSSAWSAAESRAKNATLRLIIFSHSFGKGRALSCFRRRSFKKPKVTGNGNVSSKGCLLKVGNNRPRCRLGPPNRFMAGRTRQRDIDFGRNLKRIVGNEK